MNGRIPIALSRRQMLRTAACGFGGVALQNMVAGLAHAATRPLDARAAHHRPRAKRIIFLFMSGGPSQSDLFDPKPYIVQHHGQTIEAPVDEHQLRVGRNGTGTNRRLSSCK